MQKSTTDPIYLDYAASAPLRPEALAAEAAYRSLRCAGANPNSLHTLGREAARELDKARHTFARVLGGGFRPSDIIFTSGGTESNNLAVIGLAEGMRARNSKRTCVVLAAIEHDSVLDLAPVLRGRGFEVRIIRPKHDGTVGSDELRSVLDTNCALVSVMAANNETGVLMDIASLAKLAHASGALFHTDAVQAFCRVPLDLADVDAVSVAGHKIGAPVGTGVLAVRSRCPLKAQSFGGGQEAGKRAGTQDVCGAVTFAQVADAVFHNMDTVRPLVAARANRLYERLCAPGTQIVPTTQAHIDDTRLPGLVSVMASHVDSESLVLRLDEAGFEVSAASACSSGSLDASHVLLAMGIPRDLALGSLRISFDERVSDRELDLFAEALLNIVASAR